jgi:hypothetical protein
MGARKMNKKFAIISTSDSKYGDFLINHWLKSLINNIDLKLVDIIILDYGLKDKQKKELLSKKIKLIKCNKDGHIVNIRYRDMLKFLKKNHYSKILSCDGGDIIFQKNIVNLFYDTQDKFLVTFENLESNFIDYLIEHKPFSKKMEEEIIFTIKDKKTINGGFIIAPYDQFIELCVFMNKLIKNKKIYGPDQIVLNYFLYKRGFLPLNQSFNYVINNNKGFKIKKGVFFDENDKIIPVVHNAGGYGLFRSIKNFGYGPDYNQFSKITYVILRIFTKLKLYKIPKYFIKLKNFINF